jgi:hypothetical protein
MTRAALLLVVLAGCSPASTPAASDGGQDAGQDAGYDAGPRECITVDLCCPDGWHLVPAGTPCGDPYLDHLCGVNGIHERTIQNVCDGAGSACTQQTYVSTLVKQCPAGTYCAQTTPTTIDCPPLP